jgi:hypothetical protein
MTTTVVHDGVRARVHPTVIDHDEQMREFPDLAC